jgi:UTP-glucose-1-phosphate uridylyltransferase
LNIHKKEKDVIVEEVKELKSKGQLNPIIVNKKTDNKIEDFFGKKSDFVKRKNKSKKRKGEDAAEDIEDSESDDSVEVVYTGTSQLNKTTIPIVSSKADNK